MAKRAAKKPVKASSRKTAAKKAVRKAAKKSATKSGQHASAVAAPAPNRRKGNGGSQIVAWMDDPMGAGAPIPTPVPALPGTRLATVITEPQPAPQVYPKQSSGFRYWAAAEVLRRAATFWLNALPGNQTWQVGAQLPVHLDLGVDLNAYYDRASLSFFHDTVNGTTYYSGESPDVVAHELGHAVLDAIKPDLWNVMSIEIAAFHEAFGDISAMLTALQVQPFRALIINQTGGRISRNSPLSRLAEQLGYAIRQVSPGAVDADSLRNAANSWNYTDPTKLPQSGPAAQLTQEPHKFARLFAGGFLDMLAGMLLAAAPNPTEADLAQVSQDAAKLMVKAVIAAPIVNRFYESVANALVAQAQSQFQGKYAAAVRGAFIRRNILPATVAAAAGIAARAPVQANAAQQAPVVHEMPGSALGLPVDTVKYLAPADAAATVRMGVTGESADSSRAFVERIVQRLRLDAGAERMSLAAHPAQARHSHRLVKRGGDMFIERQFFDCGF
jgi:hypothetical protein